MKKILFVVLILIILIQNGCEKKKQDYFPLSTGNTWRYKTNMGSPLTVVVKNQKTIGDWNCFVVESFTYDKKNCVKSDYFAQKDDGIYCLRSSFPVTSMFFDPPITILRFPLKKGLSWKWTGKIGIFDAKYFYRVLGRESLLILGKKYSAIKVHVKGNTSVIGDYEADRWYAPNIGMIKEDSKTIKDNNEIHVVLELASYNVKVDEK